MPTTSDELMSVPQVAELWGVTRAYVARLCQAERLPRMTVAGRYIIRRADAEAFQHQPRGRPTDQAKTTPKATRKGKMK